MLIKEKRNLVDEQPEEEVKPEIEPLYRVVDLTGEDQDSNEGDNYMYFLAKVHGKHLIDPFQEDLNIGFGSDSGSDNPYEKDSQDSNRESAE